MKTSSKMTDGPSLSPYFQQISIITFIGPCIANVFSGYNQQDETFLKLIYFCKRLYMFETGIPSIIRRTKLHIERQACLTLYVQFCAPDDGRKNRLKHIERLTKIN